MTQIYQCDNTNSVKYIIEKEECSLLKTRNFSHQDAEEFLMYASTDQFRHLTKQSINSIVNFASHNPEIIKEEMLDSLFENGLCLEYTDAKKYTHRNMDGHLDKLLPRLNLTQGQYVDLWCTGTKCKSIISQYFNDEAKDILIKKRKEYVMGNAINITIIALLTIFFICGSIPMIIVGDLVIPKDKASLPGSIIMIVLGSILLFVSIVPFPLCIIWWIYECAQDIKKYNEILNSGYSRI